jgi:hypothetical protein
MRKLLIVVSAAVIAAPVFTAVGLPTEALASARDCRNASTAAGGVGGAVIGGGLAHGGVGGALLGGLGGAVIGHEIAKNNCGHDRRTYRAACRTETRYRDSRPYAVRLCQGRDGVWRPT